MKKQFLFSLLALSAATGAKADGNEARLLRFPATNARTSYSPTPATSTQHPLQAVRPEG